MLIIVVDLELLYLVEVSILELRVILISSKIFK